MQKLDFVKNLETISTELNSVSIKKHFDNALHAPGNGYDFGQINPILFRSKSRFDQLVQNVNLNAILQSLGAFNVYREDNLSSLTTHLRSNSLRDIFLVKNCLELYNLHATILSTLSLSKTLLLNPSISESNEQSLENGIVVFQVSIVEDSLDIDTYIKIFSKL